MNGTECPPPCRRAEPVKCGEGSGDAAMSDFPDDIFIEPEDIDPDTLANLAAAAVCRDLGRN
jgi:hypothetical protein